MLTVIAPRVAVPRPDMPKKERYLHASHIVGGLGRRQQPVFFRERKISEYGECSRWGASHKRRAEYLTPSHPSRWAGYLTSGSGGKLSGPPLGRGKLTGAVAVEDEDFHRFHGIRFDVGVGLRDDRVTAAVSMASCVHLCNCAKSATAGRISGIRVPSRRLYPHAPGPHGAFARMGP